MCGFETGKRFTKSNHLKYCRSRQDVVWIAASLSVIKDAHLAI
jgi:hypothetical protein